MISDEIVYKSDAFGEKIQQYVKKDIIGSGGFARCYLMINQRTQEKLAGKVINKKQLRDKTARAKVMQEIDIHQSTHHPHVVKFYEMFQFEGELYLMLELCQNNSLREFLKSRIRITEFEAKYYLLQIIEGIQYLHQQGILHRDIKLGNIFLNYKMQIKIGDFGLSTKINPRERRFTTCGTPNYIAPEILSEVGHSFEVDVWAVGIIFYALLIGKPPFQSETVEETYQKIKENNFSFPKQIPISTDAKNLIKQILQPNPRLRLTLQQIKNHDFLNRNIHKIPELMPPYTISIPPQNSFLKQYISESHFKLSIYPRKISKITGEFEDEAISENQNKKQKMALTKDGRVLSLDKNIFRMKQALQKSIKIGNDNTYLNRGVIYNKNKEIKCLNKLKSVPKIQARQKTNEKKQSNKYEEDLNEIICYFDMSDQYGIGYLLSNGNYGVIFRDQTSLTKLTNQTYLYYRKEVQTFAVLPETLQKKQSILNLCEEKIAKYKQKHVFIEYPSEIFGKKYLTFQNTLVLKLSNSIFQFFWGNDCLTLRSYKWVKWKLNGKEGETDINANVIHPNVQIKIKVIKQFLSQYSLAQKNSKR